MDAYAAAYQKMRGVPPCGYATRYTAAGIPAYCDVEAVATVHKPQWGERNAGAYCSAHAETVRANNSQFGTQAQLIAI